MGRIKSSLVKRTTRKLQKEQKFSREFDKNKKIIEGITPSKRIRNKIAGYLSKLNKKKDSD